MESKRAIELVLTTAISQSQNHAKIYKLSEIMKLRAKIQVGHYLSMNAIASHLASGNPAINTRYKLCEG